MKSRRSRRRSTHDALEENGGGKNVSPRKRAKVKDPEVEDKETEENDVKDEKDVEQQPLPTLSSDRKKPPRHSSLLVTCGSKKAILDVDKMDMGEAFIKCEGHWIFPQVFEDYGGKASSKKWKSSIYYQNKPLAFWFEQGFLRTEGLSRRRTLQKKSSPSSDDTQVSSCEEPDTEKKEAKKKLAEESAEVEADSEVFRGGEEEGESAMARIIPEKIIYQRKAKVKKKKKANDSHSAVSEPSSIGLNPLPIVPQQGNKNGQEATGNSITPPSVSAAFSPVIQLEILNKSEDMDFLITGINAEAAPVEDLEHCGEEENEITGKEMEPETQAPSQDFQLHQNAAESPDTCPEIPGSEAGCQTFTLGEYGDVPYRGFKKEDIEATDSTDATDATPSNHNAPEFQMTMRETGVQQVSDSPPAAATSAMGEALSSDLDTMDLDQLKKEKIKMQLKVLKLQEEYYTLKINRQKL